MFDISWTEFLLVGVVALIVIGPKELPGVLRTLGQYTRKVRSMATEFQNQFQEALREAEMADLKKQVDDMAHDIKSYDPLKDVRTDVEAMSKDIERSFDGGMPEPKPETPAAGETATPELAVPAIVTQELATQESAAQEIASSSAEAAAPAVPVERDLEPAGTEVAPSKPERAAEPAAPDNPERPA
jgi:sec-independent protein translocase protein TatB